MPTVGDVLDALEKLAPRQYALPDDRIGLQVGSREGQVTKLVTALDRSHGAICHAARIGAQMLLTHHPLIWEPMKRILDSDYTGAAVLDLARNKMAFACAHTNWDAAPGGVNDTLVDLLGIADARPFGISRPIERHLLCTYVPEEALQTVIDALAEVGAGVIGLYRRCAYFSPGTGTFLAMPGSDPAVGEVGTVEQAPEVKLEMVVPETSTERAIDALRRAHPYEEPAFQLHKLHSPPGQALGRIGALAPTSLQDLQAIIDTALETRSLTWGDPQTLVSSVAVVGGAAADEWKAAAEAGAQVLVTGEVPQHVALEASESGIALVAAGHYATENPGMRSLARMLAAELPKVEVSHFEPEPGQAGRPLR